MPIATLVLANHGKPPLLIIALQVAHLVSAFPEPVFGSTMVFRPCTLNVALLGRSIGGAVSQNGEMYGNVWKCGAQWPVYSVQS